MKKLLLASAIAALSVSAANAAPTVYGKAFLTMDYQSVDTDTTLTGKPTTTSTEDRAKLNSIGSRIGLKGSEPLMAGTDVVYKLEYQIDVDGEVSAVKAKPQFRSRDTYLGLSNKQYGTVLVGRMKAIDGQVDFANVAQGGVLGGDNVLATWDAPRANNALAYMSPDYNGMQVMAMYVLDENDTVQDSLNRDAFGLAAKYAMGQMNVGASYIYAGDAKGKFARISGDYAVNDAITLGALYQNGDYNSDDNESAFTISGKMKTATPWTPYAQYDMVSNAEGASDADKMRAVVGSTYNFNKATIGHVYGAYIKNDSKTAAKEVEKSGYGVGAGIEYKF